VPVGYAEGLPRNASGKAHVSINGKSYPILSRIAMDQFVLDVGDDNVKVGDDVILFGDPAKGHPSVDDLADAADTINYEIVTRMGGRFKREYVGSGK
jgi:alanine racemase